MQKPVQPQSWQHLLATKPDALRIHLIGIGGAGLSAIANVLLDLGAQISGSDRMSGANTERLAEKGVAVAAGHSPANLTLLEGSPHVVLISSAIDQENPELLAASEHGIPVVKRAEFLPQLLAERDLIAVAGTHGKSTTSAMIVTILKEAGIDVGYIVGAEVPGFGNASAGLHRTFVLEADEYDRMFLGLQPRVAVITNVEWDHPDCFPSPASFRKAFMQFVDGVERDGMVISCADDRGAEQLRAYNFSRGAKWITYGIDGQADLRAQEPEPRSGSGFQAELFWWNAPVGQLRLQVPGRHNVENALAALATGSWCGVPFEQALVSLGKFTGASRRFEIKGEAGGITVIDDYAHHPTEVAATLSATRHRYPERRIWAVFQPHTFSRTERMLYRMGDSFRDADQVIVTDIYAAREVDNGRVSAAELVAASEHGSIRHIAELAEVTRFLLANVQTGDVVITLGAGDGYKIGESLLAQLS